MSFPNVKAEIPMPGVGCALDNHVAPFTIELYNRTNDWPFVCFQYSGGARAQGWKTRNQGVLQE